MVRIIRSGRTLETKQKLLTEFAAVRSETTGEPMEGFALWLQELPSSVTMEEGRILQEASED
jgi:hypothetical protein